MAKNFRSFVKNNVPRPILLSAWNSICRLRAQSAKQAFLDAPKSPEWLSIEELPPLMAKYPAQHFDYTYEQPKLEKRARERIEMMLSGVPAREREQLNSFLDLGAWDGTVCQVLSEMGKETVGIDIRSEGYTDYAVKSGAILTQMDADLLALGDNTFDFTFSFNSFEHFPNPDLALMEAIRVTKPGGYIYLNFGPLYFASKGAHQFKTIGIPFVQCLFSEPTLEEFSERQNIELMGFHWLNEWSAESFRQLRQTAEAQVNTVFYREELAVEGIELVNQYPSCFKSKSDSFDDFLVSYIEWMCVKR